jgi:preprotein translocase subunit SecG
MYGLILSLHVLLCVLLVLIVLIQSGRSGGFSGLLGGGGGDALFTTSSQQSGLRKATVVIAGLYFLTSIFLTKIGGSRGANTVFNREIPMAPPLQVPAAPAQPNSASQAEQPAQGNVPAPKAPTTK